MEIKNLKTNPLNQNNYNINKQTPDQVGSLVVYPVNYTHENTLSCDGYVLLIEDYPLLYSVIGKKFNTGTEQATEFRIPDYNISGRFLQPSSSPATKKEAGLPNITGVVGAIGATGATHTGAFYNYGKGGVLSNSGEADYNAGFNASRCSTIYGNSTTVQPPSQGVHVCIRYK
ncbi:MAG: tail fiber protein [Clostridia bacterium]|nr:tail fiber protein [Clostridia bacterium]MEE0495666.1 phage tail protein [Cyanobacteriota bacterium]